MHVDVPRLELPRLEMGAARELQLELVRAARDVEDGAARAFDGELPGVDSAHVQLAPAARRDGAIGPTREGGSHDGPAAPGDRVQVRRLDGDRHLARAPDARAGLEADVQGPVLDARLDRLQDVLGRFQAHRPARADGDGRADARGDVHGVERRHLAVLGGR